MIPTAIVRRCDPYIVSEPGKWWVTGDQHIPFHDRRTIDVGVKLAKKEKVDGILLNGDVLDHHRFSRFDKDPSAPRYTKELKKGKQFLEHLRAEFPRARIIYKAGNHDERLRLYVIRKAEELFGLEEITLPHLLDFAKYGIEWVSDKRIVKLGKLNVIHGHEYPQGSNSPVNPARGLFLKAKRLALCSHFHQTSEHCEPDIEGRPSAAWSIGCACGLKPEWHPYNKWNHGFAFVTIGDCGRFAVRNLRVWKGEIL